MSKLNLFSSNNSTFSIRKEFDVTSKVKNINKFNESKIPGKNFSLIPSIFLSKEIHQTFFSKKTQNEEKKDKPTTSKDHPFYGRNLQLKINHELISNTLEKSTSPINNLNPTFHKLNIINTSSKNNTNTNFFSSPISLNQRKIKTYMTPGKKIHYNNSSHNNTKYINLDIQQNFNKNKIESSDGIINGIPENLNFTNQNYKKSRENLIEKIQDSNFIDSTLQIKKNKKKFDISRNDKEILPNIQNFNSNINKSIDLNINNSVNHSVKNPNENFINDNKNSSINEKKEKNIINLEFKIIKKKCKNYSVDLTNNLNNPKIMPEDLHNPNLNIQNNQIPKIIKNQFNCIISDNLSKSTKNIPNYKDSKLTSSLSSNFLNLNVYNQINSNKFKENPNLIKNISEINSSFYADTLPVKQVNLNLKSNIKKNSNLCDVGTETKLNFNDINFQNRNEENKTNCHYNIFNSKNNSILKVQTIMKKDILIEDLLNRKYIKTNSFDILRNNNSKILADNNNILYNKGIKKKLKLKNSKNDIYLNIPEEEENLKTQSDKNSEKDFDIYFVDKPRKTIVYNKNNSNLKSNYMHLQDFNISVINEKESYKIPEDKEKNKDKKINKNLSEENKTFVVNKNLTRKQKDFVIKSVDINLPENILNFPGYKENKPKSKFFEIKNKNTLNLQIKPNKSNKITKIKLKESFKNIIKSPEKEFSSIKVEKIKQNIQENLISNKKNTENNISYGEEIEKYYKSCPNEQIDVILDEEFFKIIENPKLKNKLSLFNTSIDSVSSISSHNTSYPIITQKLNTLNRIFTKSLNKNEKDDDEKKKNRTISNFYNNFHNPFIKKSLVENKNYNDNNLKNKVKFKFIRKIKKF